MISSFPDEILELVAIGEWCTLGKCFSFHLEVDFYVGVGGRNMDMAQPALDDVEFRAGAEKTHGGRVAERVRAHLLFCQAGHLPAAAFVLLFMMS